MVENLCVSTAGGMGFIPGWGTKILRALCCSQKGKKKRKISPVFYQKLHGFRFYIKYTIYLGGFLYLEGGVDQNTI